MEQEDMSASQTTIGRFAPTPSGRMHLGNIFAALLCWLAVRSAGGRMILRIEDLDPRTRNGNAIATLIEDLKWLGLDWDEGPIFQSSHNAFYQQALNSLQAKGLIYPCFCTRSELHVATAPHTSDGTYVYPGTCRRLSEEEVRQRAKIHPYALRLIVPDGSDPNGQLIVDDLVYGKHVENLAHDCGDFLVKRSDGIFAYQLACVVDDGISDVNLVVRGHDLLGSSARQSYLAHLLGFKQPAYGHVPLLIAPDGRRLSKREKDLDLGALRANGISSERIIGVLAASVGLIDRQVDITPAELVDTFSWEVIRAHSHDIVVDKSFLTKLGIAVSPLGGV
jgi:glutamyl-tRNA synthetase